MKSLAVLGAGGHGGVVAEIAELNGWQVVFFDDCYPSQRSVHEQWPVLGDYKALCADIDKYSGCFVAIGNNKVRLEKLNGLSVLGARIPVLVHPNSVISKYSSIEDGSVVMANAVVNPFVQIGKGCIVNTAATIDHDCVISDGVHLSPGVHLAGAAQVGMHSWIGIGASVRHDVRLGDSVIVGAGAAVVKDIQDEQTVVGVPAKNIEN
ncbi:acetyltransferase [Thiomicrorhabdus sediminis]|uniref:Acetyltransferase n=1 Tax=Thiomicrorhabdus sediminis TaxID=2580412 RepID=A0A4P9K557_9GAMM|nr:acetyltransferase [Thiomicrorhabdus sediminis]QCU89570.1 acetyltransferase [Thiomicrorhabdus sediminis]